MGNRKLKWTKEEEEALKAGVAKYGAGKWKDILHDSQLNLKLAYRSNVDLKDKWRNLGVTIGQGSGANTMTPDEQTTSIAALPPKTENSSSVSPNEQATTSTALPPKTENSSVATKDNINEKHSRSSRRAKNEKHSQSSRRAKNEKHSRSSSTPLPPKTENSSSVATKDNINEKHSQSSRRAKNEKHSQSSSTALPPKTENSSSVATKDNMNEKHSQSSRRAKNGPTYMEMILDALSSINDHNGSDLSSIMEFIEKKYDVPQNFRKKLSSKLRKLIMQGKVEKVHKHYKIKKASLAVKKASLAKKASLSIKKASLAIKTPSPKQKTVKSKPRQKPRLCFSAKAVEDAANTIARHIAAAEHKSFIAAEAINKSERVARMAEDSDAEVMHLKEILEQLERTKQTSSIGAEAINESERVARVTEDSDAAIMHLKEIFEQWKKIKQTALSTEAPVRISRPSFT